MKKNKVPIQGLIGCIIVFTVLWTLGMMFTILFVIMICPESQEWLAIQTGVVKWIACAALCIIITRICKYEWMDVKTQELYKSNFKMAALVVWILYTVHTLIWVFVLTERGY